MLLIEGAWLITHPNEPWIAPKKLAVGIAVYATLGAVLFRPLELVGLLQHSAVAIVLLAFSFVMWRQVQA